MSRALLALLLLAPLGCGKPDDDGGGAGGGSTGTGKAATPRAAGSPTAPFTGRDLTDSEYRAMAASAMDAEDLLNDFKTDPEKATSHYDGWVAVRLRVDRAGAGAKGTVAVTHRGADGGTIEAFVPGTSGDLVKKGKWLVVVGNVAAVAPDGSRFMVVGVRHVSRP